MSIAVPVPEPDDAKTGDVRILIVDGKHRLQVRVKTVYSHDADWIEPRGIDLSGPVYQLAGTANATLMIDATITPSAIHVLQAADAS